MVQKEDVAIGRQVEGANDGFRAEMVATTEPGQVRPKSWLRQQEQDGKDLESKDGDLHHRPEPAARPGCRFGRSRRRTPPFLNGPDRHASFPEPSSRESIAVWERCLSANRSMASSINRAISFAYGRPDASQSLGYMLIRVKPGMVFNSLSRTRPLPR